MFKAAQRNFVLYWITIFWVFFVSLQSLLGSFIAQTYHINFFSESKGDQAMTIINCTWAWSGSMIALLVTLGKREKQGKSLIPDDENGNTIILTKQQNEVKNSTA